MPRLSPDELGLLPDELAADGRVPATVLADRTGIPVRRVRDALAAMQANGSLVIRVDIARAFTPWPVYTWYFLRVPAAQAGDIGSRLARLEEVRMVASAVGDYNILMAAWLRSLGDIGRMEAAIEAKLPGAVIADRSVVLRTVEHAGHLLDPHGNATAADRVAPAES